MSDPGRYRHTSGPLSTLIERSFWNLHSLTWEDLLRRGDDPQLVRSRAMWLAEQRKSDSETVLDVGCGTGIYAVALAERGFRIVGIDFAGAMLRKAWEKASALPPGAVTFERSDFNEGLRFPDASFDHAICMLAIQCADDPAALLGEIRRVLKPMGCLLLLAPEARAEGFSARNRRQGSQPPARKRPLPERAVWFVKRMFKRTNRWTKLTSEELSALLHGASFDIVGVRSPGRAVEILARASAPSS